MRHDGAAFVPPERLMRDFYWLQEQTVRHGEVVTDSVLQYAPIIDQPALIDGLGGVLRKSITLITASPNSNAAFGIPFRLGEMANSKDESFKMILAQKMLIAHSTTIFSKLINGFYRSECPIKLRPKQFLRGDEQSIDQGTNLHVCTYPYTYNLIEEALDRGGSKLTHLVLDGFDGEKCIELELLSLAVELTRIDRNFRVIVITDGLVADVRHRVESLCGDEESFAHIELMNNDMERPRRDIVVFNEKEEGSQPVSSDTYVASTSNFTMFDVDSKMGLSLSEVHSVQCDATRMIQYFLGIEYQESKDPCFVYVVFTPSAKMSFSVKFQLNSVLQKCDVCCVVITKNNDLNFISQYRDTDRVIYFVSEAAEESFAHNNINVVFDLSLTQFKERINPVGVNLTKVMWADRVTILRRANHIHKGTVAYPFHLDHLHSMLRTSINRPPAFDLDVRYFHDNRKWRKLLKDERSEKLMGTVQKMAIRSGLIAHDGVCTPIGSFCWGVLPSLLPRLSKLVLCGIVCGCVQAAVSLAIVLSDDTAVIDCSKRMKELKTLVNLDVHSDHLAMMHAYDSRNSDMSIFKKSTINGMERKEKTVWKVLKNLPHPNDVFLSQEKIANDSEQEKRLLLAIAMSLGDRIGYCRASEGQTVSHSFITRDPDDEKEYSFESYVFAQPNFDSVGVYCEMREREHYKSGIISMAEVSIIPVSIMGAIGNIGGEMKRGETSLLLTTNCEPLHITLSDESHVEEVLDLRQEVEKEVEKVALAYLQYPNREGCPVALKKTERTQWMDELIPLITL